MQIVTILRKDSAQVEVAVESGKLMELFLILDDAKSVEKYKVNGMGTSTLNFYYSGFVADGKLVERFYENQDL